MAAAQPQALPDQAEFESITLTEIGHRFKYNRDAVIDWCRTLWIVGFQDDLPHLWRTVSTRRVQSLYR